MMKREGCVLTLLLALSLTACGTAAYDDGRTGNADEVMSLVEDRGDSHSKTENESWDVTSAEDNATLFLISDHEVRENIVDTFGISISLPENRNWIVDREDHLSDESNLAITYYDSVADADCTILVSKNGNLTLPEMEYDETRSESWEGKTVSNQNIMVKVQHGKNDNKAVLATWEYKEYRFAITGEVEKSSDSIPKTALYIINNLN